MRLHLIESDHQSVEAAEAAEAAECAFASFLFHASLVWFGVGVIAGARALSQDERLTTPFALLPPDSHEAPPPGQTDVFQLGQPGGLFADGVVLDAAGTGTRTGGRPYGRQRAGEHSSALGLVPFGPPTRLADSVFTMLQVDRMVERYEGSAAPVYPPKLSARGKEGRVEVTFVVETTGLVEMTSVQVLASDDPEFTESVRTALGQMRFRPATRGGQPVRQLVAQRFNFRIAPPGQVILQLS